MTRPLLPPGTPGDMPRRRPAPVGAAVKLGAYWSSTGYVHPISRPRLVRVGIYRSVTTNEIFEVRED